jgi:hypothetical protein
MLLSRFQSVRYRRSGLMLVLLRLILRSTRAHKSFRLVALHALRPLVYIIPARMQWPGKDDLPF